MASVKDLMRRRVSTPRRAQTVATVDTTSDFAPKSRVLDKVAVQTMVDNTTPVCDSRDAPVLPTAVNDTVHDTAATITLSAKDALAVSADQQLLESAHIDVTETRNTLEQMDSAISGLADWRKERAENLAKLRRQLRREVSCPLQY